MGQILTEKQLLESVVKISRRTLRSLRERGVVPYIRAGSKTFLYSPDAVLKALERHERKAASE